MSLRAIRVLRGVERVLCHRVSAVSSAETRAKMGNYFFSTKSADIQSDSSGSPPQADSEFRRLSDSDWKQRLTPEQYHVCRKKGTERAFTSGLLDNKQKGMYTCVACGAPLFESKTKFDSGSGWPSFFDIIKEGGAGQSVITKTDRSLGMVRTEVLCAKCESHLGHVFSDGPAPTGLRYCINGVSLNFVANEDKEEL